jgi:hypothetical protein
MSRPRPDWRSISKSDKPVPSGYARIYARAVLDFRAAFDAIWEAEARPTSPGSRSRLRPLRALRP